jgi:hypothetical protein
MNWSPRNLGRLRYQLGIDHDKSDIDQIIEATRNSVLRKLTINQLLAYLALCRKGTREQAAALLGSDPSPVGGWKTKFENLIESLAGEPPFTASAHHGAPFDVTASGRLFAKHAEQIVRHVFILTRELQKPRPVRLALSNYMAEIPFVGKILKQAQAELKTPLEIRHISADEKASVLKEHLVDFVFAAILAKNGEPFGLDPAVAFQPFLKPRIGLLSNYKLVPAPTVGEILKREQTFLLPPTRGAFLDILKTFLTAQEIEDLPGPRTYDIHLALDMLRLRLQPKTCIIVDEELAKIIRPTRSLQTTLPFLPFDSPVTIQMGVFRLKERRAQKSGRKEAAREDHPLLAFQNIVLEHLAKTPLALPAP